MANLEEHVKIGHICLTNLSCRACHWKSSELPALVNHVRKEHTELLFFTCLNCKRVFPNQNELEKHRKRKHLLFKCTMCEFVTDLAPTLVSHVEACVSQTVAGTVSQDASGIMSQDASESVSQDASESVSQEASEFVSQDGTEPHPKSDRNGEKEYFELPLSFPPTEGKLDLENKSENVKENQTTAETEIETNTACENEKNHDESFESGNDIETNVPKNKEIVRKRRSFKNCNELQKKATSKTKAKPKKADLTVIELQEIKNQRQKHLCTICDLRLSNLPSLYSHMKNVHKESLKKNPKKNKPIYETCDQCGKKVKELPKHLKFVHEIFDVKIELKECQNYKAVDLPPLPEISIENPSMRQKNMVAHAIKHHSGRATLQEIHIFIQKQFPYYADRVKILVKSILDANNNCFPKEKEMIKGHMLNTYRINHHEWALDRDGQKQVELKKKNKENFEFSSKKVKLDLENGAENVEEAQTKAETETETNTAGENEKNHDESFESGNDIETNVPKNKEIVRKRRPINFSLKDLEDDESGDDTWNATPKASDSARIGSRAKKTRILPRRKAASKNQKI